MYADTSFLWLNGTSRAKVRIDTVHCYDTNVVQLALARPYLCLSPISSILTFEWQEPFLSNISQLNHLGAVRISRTLSNPLRLILLFRLS